MFLINAVILDQDFCLVKADLEIEGGKILQVAPALSFQEQDLAVDCAGYTIVPGFVDIHIHGCAGFDTMDGTRQALEGIAQFLLTKGVTSFCPTTMTMDRESILAAVRNAEACRKNPCQGARVVGVNMEGPFIAEKRKGAQMADYIMKPDYPFFQEALAAGNGIIKLVDVAPEQDTQGSFVRCACKHCTVSIAHTVTGYDGAKAAFDSGTRHATHLFNAMSGLTHREPGVVGAVFDDDRITAELICDGHHIHPAVLRTAFRLLKDRAVVVSDSMRANGLPEGETFDLGGQAVTVRDGLATLADGTIAGSVTNLHQEIKNLVAFGIPLEEAVKAATLTPAKVIGMDREIGSIAPGKCADLVVLDENLDIAAVYHETT